MTSFTFVMTTVMRWKVEEARRGADDEARLCLLTEMTTRFYTCQVITHPDWRMSIGDSISMEWELINTLQLILFFRCFYLEREVNGIYDTTFSFFFFFLL